MLPILVAYLAGVITLLSPCVLPVLPLILSGVSGHKSRSYGIVLGFTASFTTLTLFLSTLVKILGFSPDIIRSLAIFFIAFFALTILIAPLQLFWERLTSKFLPKTQSTTSNDFIGGVIFGVNLAILWTPCVGPILASVISLALVGTVTLQTFFITLSYSLGTATMMLLVINFGRKLTSKITNPVVFQKILAYLMLATAIAMYFGYDRKLQATLLQYVPTVQVLESLEKNVNLNTPKPTLEDNKIINFLDNLKYPQAPDFNANSTWLNTPKPLSLSSDLKGKVVLVDFWTYTCINCIRTLPYVQKWQETYAKQGFTVIGVHSPEFEFEKSTTNVQKAIDEYKLTYPVVQDNDFNIWNSYNNQYWPAHYLIDKSGRIVYTHFGEGKYVETENKIRELLEQEAISEISEASPSRQYLTPETYLGSLRATGPSSSSPPGQDQYFLSGDWQSQGEYVQSQKNSKLELSFTAKHVYLVLEPADKPAKLRVNLNGQLVQEILVDSAKEYDILTLPKYQQNQLLQLDFDPGIRAFAFTFGG